MITVLHIAQHPPDQADVGEVGQWVAAAVACVQHVERLDVHAELVVIGDTLRQAAVQPVQRVTSRLSGSGHGRDGSRGIPVAARACACDRGCASGRF